MTANNEAYPLVTVVTPHLPGRRDVLLERCVPSVLGQDWPGPIQHVIISDPLDDPERLQGAWMGRRIGQLPEHDATWPGPRFMNLAQVGDNWRNETTARSTGGVAWMIGSYLALGEFVAFCGDDDELLPYHVSAHVAAMREAEAMWSVSRVEFQVGGRPTGMVIGDDSYELGHLDSDGIMCWRGALAVARWNPNGENATDWQMVRDWRAAGLRGTFVDQITAVHHDGWAAGRSGVA